MVGEDGGLRMATILNRRLYIWSRAEYGQDADEGWTLSQVIELENVLTDSAFSNVIGACSQVFEGADGIGVILLWSGDGLFAIDLKSQQATKLCQNHNILSGVFACMSFYTPVLRLASKSEEPSNSASGD